MMVTVTYTEYEGLTEQDRLRAARFLDAVDDEMYAQTMLVSAWYVERDENVGTDACVSCKVPFMFGEYMYHHDNHGDEMFCLECAMNLVGVDNLRVPEFLLSGNEVA